MALKGKDEFEAYYLLDIFVCFAHYSVAHYGGGCYACRVY